MNIVTQSFSQNPDSPTLNPPEVGVAIKITIRQSTPILTGTIVTSKSTREVLFDSILENATLVYVRESDLHPSAFAVTQDMIVFPEDIHTSGDFCIAYFNLIIRYDEPRKEWDRHYFTATFLNYHSETILF